QVEDQVALLVAGDISGVQDFIYTITSRGATPGLRGRSFYLQLLTDAVARYVLRRLDLPITNLIYAGGGNFYLLARPGDLEELTKIQQEISRALLQHHRGALYLAVAGAPLAGKDFFQGRISRAWGQVHEVLQAVKARRFAELPAEELAQLFQPQGSGGNEEGQCQVCGQEHEQVEQEDATDPESVRKCPACVAFEKLGDELRNARFVALDLIESQPVVLDLSQSYGTWQDVLAALGTRVQVCSALQDVPQMTGQGRRVLLALDDDSVGELRPGARLAVGRRLLVNTTPTLQATERANLLEDASFSQSDKDDLPQAGRVKPFSVLAHQAEGIKRLGVLRMDVDNLGRIFREGLGEAATLSRVASLSFAVSLYFEGWVAALAESMKTQWGDRLYAIYSGGDDLFFVGAWDAVAELAIRIRADLSRYTGGHPAIHASGGMVLIGGKYPLYQAAQDAGDAEHRAK
ncbi:MAG: type III-A CRISPR-associated protein Cas10/Csm1, partial [Caldilineae bacterium]